MKLKSTRPKKGKNSPDFVPRVYTLADIGETGDLAMDLSNLTSLNDPWLQQYNYESEQMGLTEGETSLSFGLGMPYEEPDYYGGDRLRERSNRW